MALGKYLMELDSKSLIEIIDDPENWGTEYQDRAEDELDDRNLPPEEVRALAITVNEGIAYKVIMNDAISKAELSMHKSRFLSAAEIKQIYIEQLEKYIKYKDQFRFDVWSYAVGGL